MDGSLIIFLILSNFIMIPIVIISYSLVVRNNNSKNLIQQQKSIENSKTKEESSNEIAEEEESSDEIAEEEKSSDSRSSNEIAKEQKSYKEEKSYKEKSPVNTDKCKYHINGNEYEIEMKKDGYPWPLYYQLLNIFPSLYERQQAYKYASDKAKIFENVYTSVKNNLYSIYLGAYDCNTKPIEDEDLKIKYCKSILFDILNITEKEAKQMFQGTISRYHRCSTTQQKNKKECINLENFLLAKKTEAIKKLKNNPETIPLVEEAYEILATDWKNRELFKKYGVFPSEKARNICKIYGCKEKIKTEPDLQGYRTYLGNNKVVSEEKNKWFYQSENKWCNLYGTCDIFKK